VRKIVAILFFAIYLLSATEAHQLLKIPVVFEHYSEHYQENSKISFLQYLAMHYLHTNTPRNHGRHMELPFKDSGDCINTGTVASVPFLIQFSIIKPVIIIDREPFISCYQQTLSTYSANIWQPPKGL
jgi:hypothetical protein